MVFSYYDDYKGVTKKGLIIIWVVAGILLIVAFSTMGVSITNILAWIFFGIAFLLGIILTLNYLKSSKRSKKAKKED
jgi:hypothetical protein